MKTILVIEDNNEVRENAAEILELSGYQVLTAANGKEGVTLAQSANPDLIICDVMMPGLDGYGVLHMLRRNPTTRHTPFIFLTAKTEKADMRKGMELGADDYITKPFDGIELLNAVEVRLKKAESLRQMFSKEAGQPQESTSQPPDSPALTSGEREIRNFTGKQLLYKEGDRPKALYYVIHGRVKIYKNHQIGKTFITQIAGPGEFIGYVPILEEAVYPDNAEVMEDAEIMLIPRSEFQQLITGSPPVAGQFIKLMAKHLSEKEEAMVQMAYNSLRKKVVFALLQLLNKNQASASKYTLFISREDLANTIGIATESLIRTLAEFKDEGMIELEKGRVTIINEMGLRNLSY